MSFPIRHDSRKKKKASSYSASTASAVPRTTSFCLHIPLQAMSNPTEDFDCPTGLCPPPTNPLNPNNPAPVTSAMASSSSAPPGSSSTSAYPTDTTPSTNETPTTNPAPVTSSSTPSIENPKPQDQSDPALLDPSTFVQPLVENLPGWRIVIEFCDRCRWLHRACWVQTELFLTFPSPAIKAISLIPLNSPETGGRFRVWLFEGKEGGDEKGKGKGELVWDRKIEGGFPELKLLKQRIRNHISPDASLGHSDKTSGKAEA